MLVAMARVGLGNVIRIVTAMVASRLASEVLFECTGEDQPYTIQATMKLTDLGIGAKTALPDHR